MIVERFQGPGSFSLRLKENTPLSIRVLLREFSNVHITPARPPAGTWDVASTLRAASIFSGVLVDTPEDAFTMQGYGARWWLGGSNMEHAGASLDADLTFTAVSLTSALTTLLPATQPINLGTITNVNTISGTWPAYTPRGDVVEQVIGLAGAEWIVQPDFTLDAGPASSLFTTTPTVILLDHPGSRATGGLVGIDARRMRTGKTGGPYATRVRAVARTTDGTPPTAGDASGAAVYIDAFGNAAAIDRIVDAPTTPGSSAATVAANLLNLATVRTTVHLEVAVDEQGGGGMINPTSVIKPGDYLYVSSLMRGVLDSTNQAYYDGALLAPAKLRLRTLGWAFAEGMGCYLRDSVSGTITDLTDYIVTEPPNVQLEVGRGSTFNDDVAAVGLGGPTAAAARGYIVPTTAWTPVLGATTTNPTLGTGSAVSGDYRVAEGMCHFNGSIQFGTAGAAAGAGTYRISGLPVTPKATRPTNLCGRARLTQANPAVNAYPDVFIDDSGNLTMRYSAIAGADTVVTEAAPWAWAAGAATNDRLEFAGSFPIV